MFSPPLATQNLHYEKQFQKCLREEDQAGHDFFLRHMRLKRFLSIWTQAIKNNHVATFSGLIIDVVHIFLQKFMATAKVQIKANRNN